MRSSSDFEEDLMPAATNDNQDLIPCACYGEGVLVSHDPKLGVIDLSLWGSLTGRPSWRGRLRHVWRILRTGTPYVDQVTLYPDEALWLARCLRERAQTMADE